MVGIDILDCFRGLHSWDRCLRLLGQLPRTSRYHAALGADEDRAEALISAGVVPDENAPVAPPLETWTQEAELLAAIVDLLAAQRADYAAVNSKSHRWRAPKPVLRPETALGRARRRAEKSQHHRLRAALLPRDSSESDP